MQYVLYATTEGPRGKSTELFQAVVQHKVRLNGKLLGEEPRNMVQQLLERPKQQCLKFLADYALTQQHFVAAGMEREQQAAIFKTDGRPIQRQEEFYDDESLQKVPYFSGQISCRLSLSFPCVFPLNASQNIHKNVAIFLTQQPFIFFVCFVSQKSRDLHTFVISLPCLDTL